MKTIIKTIGIGALVFGITYILFGFIGNEYEVAKMKIGIRIFIGMATLFSMIFALIVKIKING